MEDRAVLDFSDPKLVSTEQSVSPFSLPPLFFKGFFFLSLRVSLKRLHSPEVVGYIYTLQADSPTTTSPLLPGRMRENRGAW